MVTVEGVPQTKDWVAGGIEGTVHEARGRTRRGVPLQPRPAPVCTATAAAPCLMQMEKMQFLVSVP